MWAKFGSSSHTCPVRRFMHRVVICSTTCRRPARRSGAVIDIFKKGETLGAVASRSNVSPVLRALENNISVVLVRPSSAGYVNPPRGSVMSASPKVESACAAKRPFVRDPFFFTPILILKKTKTLTSCLRQRVGW